MENLIDALIEIDWAKTVRDYERRKAEKVSGRKRLFAYDSDDITKMITVKKSIILMSLKLIWYLSYRLF